MKSQAKLTVIKSTHRPVVDIYASWRAEIADRNWEGVHIAGDRRVPLDFLLRPVRGWRA